jgi:hypothetical protein
MAAKPKENADGGYADKFIDILNNRAKFYKYEDKDSLRTNGFVVLVGGGKDLQPIQTLYSEQGYNRCLTVRYRLQPGTFLGTLFAAFLTDLKIFGEPTPDFLGNFVPDASDSEWKELLKNPLLESLIESLPDEKSGTLKKNDIDELFESLEKIPDGRRLVLFGEIVKGSYSKQELDRAMDIFSKLPERFGLVLSGLPEDFRLPTDDPHFLEFNPPEETIKRETDDKYMMSSFHSDKPATKDYLGVYTYAEALACFVLHSQTVPPLTIGIHGPWGKGKSSFMEFVDIALVNWVKANREVNKKGLINRDELVNLDKKIKQQKMKSEKAIGQEKKSLKAELKEKESEREQLWEDMQNDAKKEVLTVRFNAWQYEDSKQIWAGLASRISETIEGTLSPWSLILMRLRYACAKYKSELHISLLFAVPIILLIIYFSLNLGKSYPLLGLLIPSGSALAIIAYLIWHSPKLVQPVSKRVLNYTQLPNYREQMGYQHKVMDDLIFVYNHLQRRMPGCKVVVFIDDLDRCSEEKIMEILQAINLILGNSKFFVFLGMETAMIYRAIRIHYSNDSKDSNFSENYLRKIVQLSFHIPKTPDEKRLEFLNTLFSTAAQDELNKSGKPRENEEMKNEMGGYIELPYDLDLPKKGEAVLKKGEAVPKTWEEVEDTTVELKTFRTYQTYIKDNPRETKRLVNIYRLIKIILQLKYPDEVPWKKERQSNLVRWLIFCTNWSDQLDIEMLSEKAENSGASSLGELIKDIIKDNPPSLLREFISHTMPTSDDDDFKLDNSELKSLELAARISQQMQLAVTSAPDIS